MSIRELGQTNNVQFDKAPFLKDLAGYCRYSQAAKRSPTSAQLLSRLQSVRSFGMWPFDSFSDTRLRSGETRGSGRACRSARFRSTRNLRWETGDARILDCRG
jgi:hypothetical protein